MLDYLKFTSSIGTKIISEQTPDLSLTIHVFNVTLYYSVSFDFEA
jgi:hypothetical protein